MYARVGIRLYDVLEWEKGSERVLYFFSFVFYESACQWKTGSSIVIKGLGAKQFRIAKG